MDVILAQDHIKPFCQAIAQLSRIGKEVYFDFLPTDGLYLRSLNDAKSAFCSFHFEPAFFQRCTSSTTSLLSSSSGKKNRKRSAPSSSRNSNSNSSEQAQEDDVDDDRYMVKVPVKTLASLIRTRKNALQLRIVTTSSSNKATAATRTTPTAGADSNLLTFEYQVQPPQGGTLVHIVHRVGVVEAQGIVAMAPTEGSTELVADPQVLSKLLEPLKNTAEVAIVVQDSVVPKMIRALTFHADNVVAAEDPAAVAADPTLLRNPLARPAPLSTETSISTDELKDYYYVSSYNNSQEDGDDVNDIITAGVPPPDDLAEQVIMVVSRKELRALLQFAAHAFSDRPLDVRLHFYYGGKPMVIQTQSGNDNEGCSATLILATLDHRKLGPLQLNNNNNNNTAAAANHHRAGNSNGQGSMKNTGMAHQQQVVATSLS